ncbi:MAG: hypothetical protein R8K50_00055 [Mariprofundus sp.]
MNTIRFTNYSEAVGTSIFMPVSALFFLLIGALLFGTAWPHSLSLTTVVISLIPISIGLAFAYFFVQSNLIYALSFGDTCDVSFVCRKNRAYAYQDIKSVKLSTQATKLYMIPINQDLYITIAMQDGLSFQLRTNQRELEKIKSILTSKGLIEAIDTKIGESPSEWLFLPPSFLDG